MNNTPRIFLFTALAAEAKPLVAQLQLKRDNAIRPFTIYTGERYCLTVTGVGKAAAAAAVAYTLALFSDRLYPVLINVGIAGHRDLPVGSVRLADVIVDGDSARRYYPGLSFSVPCRTSSLTSVSLPDLQYSRTGLIDMEASGFYQSAQHFSGNDFIHSVKVVSDNQQTPVSQLTSASAAELMSVSVSMVEKLCLELVILQAEIDQTEPEMYQFLLAQWHFTVSQKKRLLHLLKQYHLLTQSDLPTNFNSAKQCIAYLQRVNQALALSMRL